MLVKDEDSRLSSTAVRPLSLLDVALLLVKFGEVTVEEGGSDVFMIPCTEIFEAKGGRGGTLSLPTDNGTDLVLLVTRLSLLAPAD